MRTFLLGFLLTAFVVLPGAGGRGKPPEQPPSPRPAPLQGDDEIDPEWGVPKRVKADVLAGRC